jgi:hypothetical protein
MHGPSDYLTSRSLLAIAPLVAVLVIDRLAGSQGALVIAAKTVPATVRDLEEKEARPPGPLDALDKRPAHYPPFVIRHASQGSSTGSSEERGADRRQVLISDRVWGHRVDEVAEGAQPHSVIEGSGCCGRHVHLSIELHDADRP